MFDKTYFVFVYGTLKKGHAASMFLENSKFIGTAVTTPEYTLYGSVFYPGMIFEQNDQGIEGEIYLINGITKLRLDLYEGVANGLFEDIPIKIQSVKFADEFSNIAKQVMLSEVEVISYLYRGSLNKFKKINSWR